MPVHIASPANPKVKHLRSLQRRRTRYRERLFLVEGVRLVEEALAAAFPLQPALYVPEFLQRTPRGAALLAALEACPEAFSTTEELLSTVADTVTPQGVVAAVPFPDLPPRPQTLVLILDQVRDPGNCGTILRTAEAAGVDLIYMAPGTVDPFSPKVVRAGMGAHFRQPLRVVEQWAEIAAAVSGFSQILLADVHAGQSYDRVEWHLPTALIVSEEAGGASEKAAALATDRVTIPMAGGAESLNVAVAAGILLFEALRQRRLTS